MVVRNSGNVGGVRRSIVVKLLNTNDVDSYIDTIDPGKSCQEDDWPSHKRDCKAQNYVLKIDLAPKEITNPSVSRTLSCPANAIFTQLHQALQTAFGWAGTHTFDFKIKDPKAEKLPELSLADLVAQMMAQNEAQLNGTPVPDVGPRQNLLRIPEDDDDIAGGLGSMSVFGGKGIDFMHNQRRVHSKTPEIPSSKLNLSKVLDRKDYRVAPIEYEYDFGDCWTHEITVLGRAAATKKFICTDGVGYGVAEDAGGVTGWQELKESYRVAYPDKQQKERRMWFETQCSNRDHRGLGNGRDRFWDKAAVNASLSC